MKELSPLPFFKEISPDLQLKLIQTVMFLIVVYVCRYIALKLVHRRVQEHSSRYKWQKIVSFISNIIFIVLAARIWFEGVDSLATYFGFITAGLAIALKEPVSNFAGWIFILSRQPFEVGDRIQIGDHIGDVIDVRYFQFSLMELGHWVHSDNSTGRVIHIPNGFVFGHALSNYNQAFSHIWNEVAVLVTFESDWKQAKKIMVSLLQDKMFDISNRAKKELKQATLKYMLPQGKLTPIVYTHVKDSGVQLVARYLCVPHQKRATEVEFWETLLDKFADEKAIEFAYPTQRFYQEK